MERRGAKSQRGRETVLRFVVPKVSSEEAWGILNSRSRFSLRRKGEMKRAELLYLPYYVHKVVVRQGDAEHEVLACTDGIEGGFSFFNLGEMRLSDEARGEMIDFVLSPEEAERCCRENLRWHLVRQGLRLKVKASTKTILRTDQMWYPYWVAYFKKDSGYGFRAADGVTGEVQGVRMRSVFLKVFSAGAVCAAVSDSPRSTESMQRQ